MKKLILIRHGQTDFNEQRRYSGYSNIPLNNAGIDQATRLRAKARRHTIDRIYSSDLMRAYQTARIIFGKRRVTKKRYLREIDFGQMEGLTADMITERFPSQYKIWLDTPHLARMPGGESIAAFSARVWKCFEDIRKKNSGKSVAIVSHGGPIRIILLGLMGKTIGDFWKIQQRNTAFNLVKFAQGAPKFIALNDITHRNDAS
ncbi:MAG: histidine phosphatase family protein [Candidatus Omnitrophota bacterium]